MYKTEKDKYPFANILAFNGCSALQNKSGDHAVHPFLLFSRLFQIHKIF